MKTIKITSLLLLLCTIFGALVSCNDTEQTPPDTTDAASTAPETEEPSGKLTEEALDALVEGYNYMISAQTISVPYKFTDHSDGVDAALSLASLGANNIKFAPNGFNEVKAILDRCDFQALFLWYRNGQPFGDGVFSKAEEKEEYDAIYALTEQLLTAYNGTGKEFYIGNWEGDWLYLNGDPDKNKQSKPITDAMIEWVNIRQKAVDDAKKAVKHDNVNVWHYLELNRPIDAIDRGYDRIINRILPYTNVDYVSYSAYDCMRMETSDIQRVIGEINKALSPKEGVEGTRVFVGEFGYHADECGFDGSAHRSINLQAFAKFLKCDIKFLLYWELYGSEIDAEGKQTGHGLITDKGEKTLLARSIESLLRQGKAYVRDYAEKNGHAPSEEEYRKFLLKTDELKLFAK